MASSSVPVSTMPSLRIFSSLATASAVILWSPVIIPVLMPASSHFLTASLAAALGGSIMPMSPMKTRSLSISSSVRASTPPAGSLLWATPRTRRALLAILSLASRMARLLAPPLRVVELHVRAVHRHHGAALEDELGGALDVARERLPARPVDCGHALPL